MLALVLDTAAHPLTICFGPIYCCVPEKENHIASAVSMQNVCVNKLREFTYCPIKIKNAQTANVKTNCFLILNVCGVSVPDVLIT
jgi:hypothetical protein